MPERIEDINKAEEMARAEKPFRNSAQEYREEKLSEFGEENDRYAEKAGEEAGKEYDAVVARMRETGENEEGARRQIRIENLKAELDELLDDKVQSEKYAKLVADAKARGDMHMPLSYDSFLNMADRQIKRTKEELSKLAGYPETAQAVGKQSPEERKKPEKKEESEANIEALAKITQNVVDSGRKLVSVLRRREEEGLSPFIDPNEISRLKVGIDDVEDFPHVKDTETLLKGLNKIVAAMDNFGRVSSRTVRETNDGFRQTISALSDVESDYHNAASRIRETNPQVSSVLRKIADLARERERLVARKMDILSSY